MSAPGIHRLEDRKQGFAKRREPVFNLGRNLCIHRPFDQTIVLQFAELLREHLGGNSAQESLDFSVAANLRSNQMRNDQDLPRPTDVAKGVFARALPDSFAPDFAHKAFSGYPSG